MEELVHPFDLLRLLYNTPALEFLHVDVLIYEEPYMGTWQLPYDPIPLPLLRSLVFTDCPYELLNLVLPHLSLPEDVFIRLQDISNYFPVQLEGPPDAFPPLPIRPVTFLDVIMQGDELFMVADGPTSGLWLSAMHDLDGLPEPQNWGDWLLSLHECLTLTNVTCLHIFVEGCATFWPAFLSHLPQLTHLTALFEESSDEPDPDSGAFDCPTATLCAALAPPDSGVPCSVLDTLTMEWPHEIVQEDFNNLPWILEMLKSRSRAGHPIRRVVARVPLGPTFEQVQGLNFFELHELIGTGCPPDTEYEVVEKPETRRGMCVFEMREVWKVDGADRYWEVGDREKPHYDMVMSQMFKE
ncbi:hypothetical protein GSI_09999 [Ganoderma sinense ZZ0214-1]|uniref:F-box domain-containing protein n=1 Tax=Ganoderma sinense ZZ0214-1 TaxID=1077348 RepID=A0A2G8S2B6_9APHY|nr:hypothetical protein GSI_09999 [Ganoderma sinense ZZ0214-1]